MQIRIDQSMIRKTEGRLGLIDARPVLFLICFWFLITVHHCDSPGGIMGHEAEHTSCHCSPMTPTIPSISPALRS